MPKINFCPHCGSRIQDDGNFCQECGLKLYDETVKTIRIEQLRCSKSEANRLAESTPNHKKERVLKGTSAKNRNIYWLTASITILAFVIIYYSSQPTKEYKIIKDQPQVVSSASYPSTRYDQSYSIAFARNGKIILPLDVVKEKKMVKFDYFGKNITIPILAYLSEDGKVITAISMCEPCNSKDFHIQGSSLVCNSCGTSWNLNDLEAISGSCGKYPPDPIPSAVVDNEIQIDQYIVLNWQRRV